MHGRSPVARSSAGPRASGHSREPGMASGAGTQSDYKGLPASTGSQEALKTFQRNKSHPRVSSG
jgi:hypothetical protein